MIPKLLRFLKKPTSIDVVINTVGNYATVFFSALFVFILWRIFTPSAYGVLSVLFGISYVLANILDFGTTATIYSYLPPLIQQDREKSYRFIKSTFYYQSIFAVIVVAFLLVLFPWLDRVFFKTGANIPTLYLTAISVLFFIWQNFLGNCLYAARRVVQVNLYSFVSNLSKTILLFVFVYFGWVSVGSIIFLFGVVGPVVFFVLTYYEKRNHLPHILRAPVVRSDFRFRYTMTYFVASQFFNLGLRMDLFLLSFYQVGDVLGYYGLAQKIILTIISTVISITQVISPHFSSVTKRSEMWKQMKSALLYMSMPTLLFIALAVTPDWVFTLVFTEKGIETAKLSRMLALPFIAYPVLSLFHLFLLYTVKKPVFVLIANVILFATITAGCYFFIPSYSALAAVWSVSVAFILSGAVFIGSSLILAKKLPR